VPLSRNRRGRPRKQTPTQPPKSPA
jgi:hypothetical protein